MVVQLRSVSPKEALLPQEEQGYIILDVHPEGEFQGYDFGGQSLSGLGNTLHQYADKRGKLQNFRDDMSLRSRFLSCRLIQHERLMYKCTDSSRNGLIVWT